MRAAHGWVALGVLEGSIGPARADVCRRPRVVVLLFFAGAKLGDPGLNRLERSVQGVIVVTSEGKGHQLLWAVCRGVDLPSHIDRHDFVTLAMDDEQGCPDLLDIGQDLVAVLHQ